MALASALEVCSHLEEINAGSSRDQTADWQIGDKQGVGTVRGYLRHQCHYCSISMRCQKHHEFIRIDGERYN